MKYAPPTHLHDDVCNLLFAVKAAGPEESTAIRREVISASLHAVFRTLQWDHKIDYYALRSPASVRAYETLRDAAVTVSAGLDGAWDGEEYPAPVVRGCVESFIETLFRVLSPA